MSFDLKKLNDGKGKDLKRAGNFEKFRKIQTSVDVENLLQRKNISKFSQWETTLLGTEAKNFGFKKECSYFKEKKAKFQLLQNLSQLKGNNMNNKIREADRHFRSNKTEYQKEKN